MRPPNPLSVVALSLAAAAFPQDRRVPLATSPQQVALVVGNDAYPTMPLRNAVNDARAVAAALRDVGYRVDLVLDADLPVLERAVTSYVSRLRPGDVGLFYYAGHGIQVEGVNYLLPVSFSARDEVDAKFQSYSADRLHERMAATGARLNILILDACRDNPFRITRSAGGGLATMQTGKGSFIAFATAPGQTASDNAKASNGLFTGQLVEALRQPGLSLNEVFDRVRERVYEASGRRQLPWVGTSVIGSYQFRPVAQGEPSPSPSRTTMAITPGEWVVRLGKEGEDGLLIRCTVSRGGGFRCPDACGPGRSNEGSLALAPDAQSLTQTYSRSCGRTESYQLLYRVEFVRPDAMKLLRNRDWQNWSRVP